MKKYLLVIILLFAVVLASGCITGGNQAANNTSNETKNFTGDQFTFKYPSDWKQISGQAQKSIIAVGDPDSADSDGNTQVNVVIQKTVKSSDITLQDYYNATYTQFAAQNLDYTPISDGDIVINGKTDLESIYRINSGIPKQERAIWIQDKNIIYIILCSAPVSKYDDQQANFDIIVNSFKIL